MQTYQDRVIRALVRSVLLLMVGKRHEIDADDIRLMRDYLKTTDEQLVMDKCKSPLSPEK